jgi:hypothetical protein
MARRRRNRDVDLNLDSLLDTMFNVVGILVLVVIMAQLNAGEAVTRLTTRLSELPDVSPQALTEAQQRAKELKQQIDRLSENVEVDEAALKDKRITLERLKEQLKRLKEIAALDPQLQQKHEEVLATRDKLETQKNELDQRVTQASNTLQTLKAKLSDTPKRQKKPDKVVKLPRPRSAPEGWSPLYVLVANDKLYPYRRSYTHEQLRGALKQLPRRKANAKRTGGIDRNVFDRVFENRDSNHQFFKLRARAVGKYNRRPRFTFVPREEGGITQDEIETRWADLMRKMRRGQRYVRFLVKPDSFAIYLRAREVADQNKVPAGWEIRDPGWTYHYTLGGKRFRLTQSKTKIKAIDERLAKRKKNQPKQKPKDEGPDIPPPKVKRDVDGPID